MGNDKRHILHFLVANRFTCDAMVPANGWTPTFSDGVPVAPSRQQGLVLVRLATSTRHSPSWCLPRSIRLWWALLRLSDWPPHLAPGAPASTAS